MIRMIAVLCLALAVSSVALGQAKKNLKDEVQQSEKAAQVFRKIMDTPDKGIPPELLEHAECIAVNPSVLKAGCIFGGRGGRSKEVLQENKVTAPVSVRAFPLALGSFSSRLAEK